MSAVQVELGAIAQFINGAAFKPEDWGDEGQKIIRIQNLTDSSKPYNKTLRVVDQKLVVKNGDLLVSWSATLGVFEWAQEDALLNQHIFRVLPDTSKVDKKYLKYALKNAIVEMDKHLHGATMKHINRSEFLATKIPLPPLAEQKRIAAILDKADEIRRKREQTIAKLDQLAQSIFVEMFGDPVTNEKGWERKIIGNVGKVITGNTPPRENISNYGNAIEWIKSDNLNTPQYYLTTASEGLSETGKKIARTAPVGAILITCIAGSPDCIGNAGMADREVAFNQQINAFIPLNGNPHFYYGQFIVGKRLIKNASTAAMKGMVSKSRFEQIEIIVPPLALQDEYANRIIQLVNVKANHIAALTQQTQLFASLQHQAFTGNL
jgi:type I restriction enzyme S subunit